VRDSGRFGFRPHDALHHRHGSTNGSEFSHVECNREETAVIGVNQVTSAYAPRVASVVVDDCAFAGRQVLHNHLRIVPNIRTFAGCDREKQLAAAGKELRAMHPLAVLESD
jgi:hypothetical protein